MKIKFLGAAQIVSGSCHLVTTDSASFVIDCGMFQGGKDVKDHNYKDFAINPAQLDFLLLTHAHIDHSGLIPKLVKRGFSGSIYCTQPTAELLQVMLPDSAHIQETEVERKNKKAQRAGRPLIEPVYTVEEAQNSLQQIVAVNYDEILAPAENVKIRFREAGHILGSAIIEVWLQKQNREVKIVFSGDLGQHDQPIIKDPTYIEGADYVVLESTYGDRLHKRLATRLNDLEHVIKETMAKGGNLIIPSFAVERTQDLLYDLYHLEQAGKLDNIDIYIDSPLAIAATEIFQRSSAYYDQDTRDILRQGDHPFKLKNLKFSRTQEESMALNEQAGPKIIISASGMCEAGRIKHHLKHNLWRPQSTVLFVGYQAQGSLGRRILEGEKLVRIHGEDVVVKADIRTIGAYSAHADQAGLLDWLKNFTHPPRKVFLVHGEPKAQTVLAGLIEQKLGIPVTIPHWLDELQLTPGHTLTEKNTSGNAADHQRTAAENAYFNFRHDLAQLVAANLEQQKYDELLALISNLKNYLKV